jgi:hypothetical protein
MSIDYSFDGTLVNRKDGQDDTMATSSQYLLLSKVHGGYCTREYGLGIRLRRKMRHSKGGYKEWVAAHLMEPFLKNKSMQHSSCQPCL